jgi:hypothetical protein
VTRFPKVATPPANIPHGPRKSPINNRAQVPDRAGAFDNVPPEIPGADIPHGRVPKVAAHVCVCIVGCSPEERIHAEGCPCRLHYPTPQEPYP